MEFYIKYYINC